MRATTRVAVKLAVFVAVIALLMAGVVQALSRPVAGATDTLAAIFTDVNGLKSGDDVRMYGVQVGKVTSIALSGNQARVRFTVQRDRPVYQASTFAIRFQTLAGQRYIDVRQPDRPGPLLVPGATIGTDRTAGSFDITALFNGMQPLLTEFSPGALNQFAESVLAVINGDTGGIGRALDAVDKLSGYVADRQTVLAVLVSSLRSVADQLGARGENLFTLIDGLASIFEAIQQKVGVLVDFAEAGSPVFGPIDRLLAALGFTRKTNPDLDNLIGGALPDPQTALDTLGRLPGLLQSLSAALPAGPDSDLSCSHGAADVPAAFRVLIGGQGITLCKR
ncbi:MlaD family protein [Nocardia sp. NPDC051030]|uniref:MlaD family protein n=1 Tax=Nocardia sp. NPDC051030 TaxID=3155162 RepID=UPI0034188D56